MTTQLLRNDDPFNISDRGYTTVYTYIFDHFLKDYCKNVVDYNREKYGFNNTEKENCVKSLQFLNNNPGFNKGVLTYKVPVVDFNH